MNVLAKKTASVLLSPFFKAGIDVDNFISFLRRIFKLWHRPFDRLPLRGIGAEIGVYRGMHAKHMLRLHPEIESLWLVDPYTPYSKEGGLVPDLDKAKHMAQKVTKRHARKLHWLEVGSPECAELLPVLDFCYIDANHSQESVARDIEALWPKMKSGGIFGGHDFLPAWPGLVSAVVEFSVRNKLQLNVDSPDWWIFK